MRVWSLFGLAVFTCFAVPDLEAQDLDVTSVVEKHEAFTASATDDTRRALLDALAAYKSDPTVETVQAYLALMKSDTGSAEYSEMRETALATAAHLEPVSEILPRQYIEAKYVAAVSYFNHRQNADAILEMAHVEGFTRHFVDDVGEHPDWANDLKWQADAWGMAMEAYFESSRERYPGRDEVNAILDTYGSLEEAAYIGASETAVEYSLPHCPGQMIQRPKMRYPAGKAMRGMFGAVILGLEFDSEGNVINPRVLASIPVEEFDEKSLRVVGKWRYKADEPDQVGVTCRLERTDVVQPLVFEIR